MGFLFLEVQDKPQGPRGVSTETRDVLREAWSWRI